MIRTIITPDNPLVSIPIPPDYIGKKVEILLYSVEEIEESPEKKEGKSLKFRGILSKEDAILYDKHLIKTRSEWDRDI